MKSYATAVEIAAPVAKVWAVTCEIETWPSWSPTMDSITREDSGPIEVGSAALVRQPKLRPAKWVVDVADENQNFSWSTKGPGYKISAVHLFTANGDSCNAALELHVSGAMSGLIWALTGKTARKYLDQEATALKAHCEN
jgi:uncharacterized membrane protein